MDQPVLARTPYNKVLDSATCEPLDRLFYTVAECKAPHFFYTSGSSTVEFEITGYYDLGQFWHAGSEDTNLSIHVLIATICCTM